MCNKLLAISFIAVHAVVTSTNRSASRKKEHVMN